MVKSGGQDRERVRAGDGSGPWSGQMVRSGRWSGQAGGQGHFGGFELPGRQRPLQNFLIDISIQMRF